MSLNFEIVACKLRASDKRTNKQAHVYFEIDTESIGIVKGEFILKPSGCYIGRRKRKASSITNYVGYKKNRKTN